MSLPLVNPMCFANLSAILQGHIDMVCEKNNDVQHDFHKDALKLVKKGDWLKVPAICLIWSAAHVEHCSHVGWLQHQRSFVILFIQDKS